MSTVDVEVIIQRKGCRTTVRDTRAKQAAATPRVPRIARLMALAIKFQEMVDRGEVRDYADLARLGYVSRARITQIMNMLNLAADIQEELLTARTTLPERGLRQVAAVVGWGRQRRLWKELLNKSSIKR
jgi:hypothetical protein